MDEEKGSNKHGVRQICIVAWKICETEDRRPYKLLYGRLSFKSVQGIVHIWLVKVRPRAVIAKRSASQVTGRKAQESYMSVAGVKEPRLRAITAIVPAIADISKSPIAGFFRPEEEAVAAKKAYEEGTGEIQYLNFMPRNFEEGAAHYYTARGNAERYSNKAVIWSRLELVKYNVPEIMKNMKKPYLVITGENAWSKPASEDVYHAVPGDKEMHVIPEAGHFDLYDLSPYVPEAFEFITPFFAKNLRKAEQKDH